MWLLLTERQSKLTDPGHIPPWCDISYLFGRDCDNTKSTAKSRRLQNGPQSWFPTIDSGARLFCRRGSPERERSASKMYVPQHITFYPPDFEIFALNPIYGVIRNSLLSTALPRGQIAMNLGRAPSSSDRTTSNCPLRKSLKVLYVMQFF